MSRELELFIDGACQGNPGEAAVGVVVRQRNKTIETISQAIGKATNNIAEYTALIYGMQEALILRADKVKIHTDSELLYHQFRGHYKVKNANLKFLHALTQHLRKGFKHIEIIRIPREKNREADKLATKAIKREQVKMVAPTSQLFNLNEDK